MKSLWHYGGIIKEILFSAYALQKIGKVTDKKTRKEKAFRHVQKVFKKILKNLQVNVSTQGLENVPIDQPVLFVSNHQGNFDILVLMTASPVPISFIAKKEMQKYPIIKGWLQHLDCLLIDREKPKQSIRMIHEATKQMSEKGSLVIFPEGTRSKSSDMKPFKRAGLSTAIANGVTVIPVTIDGTYRIMEANNNKLKPAHVTLTFHAPITKQQTENKDEVISRIREAIESALV